MSQHTDSQNPCHCWIRHCRNCGKGIKTSFQIKFFTNCLLCYILPNIVSYVHNVMNAKISWKLS